MGFVLQRLLKTPWFAQFQDKLVDKTIFGRPLPFETHTLTMVRYFGIEQQRLLKTSRFAQFQDNSESKTRTFEHPLILKSHMSMCGIVRQRLFDINPRFAHFPNLLLGSPKVDGVLGHLWKIYSRVFVASRMVACAIPRNMVAFLHQLVAIANYYTPYKGITYRFLRSVSRRGPQHFGYRNPNLRVACRSCQ